MRPILRAGSLQGPAAWAAAAMNPQTALRGAMQRGEPIMFRITIDRLREDRRQTNHAKSQLALAFCQVLGCVRSQLRR